MKLYGKTQPKKKKSLLYGYSGVSHFQINGETINIFLVSWVLRIKKSPHNVNNWSHTYRTFLTAPLQFMSTFQTCAHMSTPVKKNKTVNYYFSFCDLKSRYIKCTYLYRSESTGISEQTQHFRFKGSFFVSTRCSADEPKRLFISLISREEII